MRRPLSSALVLAVAAACSAPSDAGDPVILPALTEARLTTAERIEPTHAVDTNASRSPSRPANLEAMLAEGFGQSRMVAGEPILTRTLDGLDAAAALPAGAVRLARFVHLADTQLADDESPSRVARLDTPGTGSGAYRPQEAFGCVMLRAAVRTINAVHRATPLDAVVLGGDNADNAQVNEIDWFLSILGGTRNVQCDSGDNDNPVAGPDNDPKDPISSEGLQAPWRWVTGNHDVLNQGTIRISVNPDEPTGSLASTGTRDWSLPGGPVRTGHFVVPDAQRAYLAPIALMKRISTDGDGHGIGAAQVASGHANYTFDLGAKVRVVVLDTAAETGSAEGVVRQPLIDSFLKPALEQAKSLGKLVIITSHHSSQNLTDGSDVGGVKQSDAVLGPAFRALLASYGNVIMHLAAHSHEHSAVVVPGARPYWEVKTSALADFPNQLKMYEVWDTGEGHIVIRGVAFDYTSDKDPLAAQARTLAITDVCSGYGQDGRGTAKHRNVDLWLPKP